MAYVPCSECDRQFIDIASFHLHFKSLHIACRKYTCKLCDINQTFERYSSFRKHLNICHQVLQNARACDQPVSQLVQTNSVNILISDVNTASCESLQVPITESIDVPVLVRDSRELLLKEADLLVAKLYQHPGFPRNQVDTVVKDFTEYVNSPCFENLREVVVSSLDPNLDVTIRDDVVKMLNAMAEPFAHLQTEYLRFKHFERNGHYIPPESFNIFVRGERVKTKGGVELRMSSVTGEFIPLRKVLTKFFELPHVLSDTLTYVQSLKDECEWLSNFIECSVWKRKISKFNADDIVIPINVYFDEVEPNSALGPHCEPLGCTYVNIPTLPPEWNSRLENIFLALLVNANDRTLYGNERVFKPLIEELLYLETHGNNVNTPEHGKVKIILPIGLILGDNKGLNGVCGFVESFSATHFCRICTCTKETSESMLCEDPAAIRTPQNYAADVAKKDPRNTGIKEKCVFDKLHSFETPTDVCVDEFHDTVEGVAHYTIIPVLSHFHSLNPAFISTMNSKFYVLDVGIDGDNRPPLINVDWFSKGKLKITGAEMYLFIRLFAVLVLDMIPEVDKFYQLYLLLHDIVSIVHAKGLPKDIGATFSLKVKEHNGLFIMLTKNTLKPKHHILSHYPRLFELFGHFGPLSTMRFESKHRLLTMTCNSCMTRVNLLKTVAIKQQLSFCFRCVCNASLRQGMSHGPTDYVDLKCFDMYPSFSSTLPQNIYDNHEKQTVTKWVDYKGTKYQSKQVLITNTDDNGLFEFSELQFVIINKGEPLFICSLLSTVGYFSEVRGYEVERIVNERNWFAIAQKDLIDPHPLCLYQMSTGEKVIVLKYLL